MLIAKQVRGQPPPPPEDLLALRRCAYGCGPTSRDTCGADEGGANLILRRLYHPAHHQIDAHRHAPIAVGFKLNASFPLLIPYDRMP